MTQYNTLNKKLSKMQLNMLRSAIKNLIGGSNDETNFPDSLLLTNI